MTPRKGILLAGGSGTRLHPATLGVSKQMLPVFDKPMIYYPLSVLMLAEIRDVLIISTPRDLPLFEAMLGDGLKLGMNLSYQIQPSPDGLAQAFILGESFLNGSKSCLILGDNIFHGHGLPEVLKTATHQEKGASVFAYRVMDPERYGVVEFDSQGKAISLEEKPEHPRSNFAVTGLYFYDEQVCDYAKSLKPSERGELEITDLNRLYLDNDLLHVYKMGRGYAWLDTGTHESLLEASHYVAAVEHRQGFKIGCLEEIAWYNGWIDDERLLQSATQLSKSGYGLYLKNLLKNKGRS